MPTYYSAHPQDAIFGATHDAFSRPWTGASIAHPHFKNKIMVKAIRWAAHSAAHSIDPCLTVLFLPKWSSASYLQYMKHPQVIFHALDHIPHNLIAFQLPCHLPPTHPHPSPKYPISIFIVANRAGIHTFYDHPSLCLQYAHATRTAHHTHRHILCPPAC